MQWCFVSPILTLRKQCKCTFRDLSLSCASDGFVEGILSPTQLLCFRTDGVTTVVCRYVSFMEIMKILIQPIHGREIRKDSFKQQKGNAHLHIEGILPKGPYLLCVSMAGRTLLAGYHRYLDCMWVAFVAGNLLFIKIRYTNYIEFNSDHISMKTVASYGWHSFSVVQSHNIYGKRFDPPVRSCIMQHPPVKLNPFTPGKGYRYQSFPINPYGGSSTREANHFGIHIICAEIYFCICT